MSNYRHGYARSTDPRKRKVYRAWKSMHYRCYNPNSEDYDDYGGRGITVCLRWHIFENYAQDVGFAPTPQHSADRKNNNEGYSPDNFRWATATEQTLNQRKRKTPVADASRNRVLELREQGLSHRKIAAIVGCSQSMAKYIINGRY